MNHPVFGSKPFSEWDKEANKAGRRLGTTYTIIRYKARGPVLVDVKIAGDTDTISAAAIREAYARHSVIWADFTDYEEDAYARGGQVFYTATATAVNPVQNELLDFGKDD